MEIASLYQAALGLMSPSVCVCTISTDHRLPLNGNQFSRTIGLGSLPMAPTLCIFWNFVQVCSNH